jgi:hypothetical protein
MTNFERTLLREMAKRFPVLLLLISSCFLLSACSNPDKDVAKTVLQEVADLVCPYPDLANFQRRYFSATDTTYEFGCSPVPGHDTSATLGWFNNQNEARAAFEARRKENTVEEFHESPLSEWGEDYFPGGREEYRVWLWQTKQWLIEVRAFNDTPYDIAPDPKTVSEAIYQVGMKHGLFTISDQ